MTIPGSTADASIYRHSVSFTAAERDSAPGDRHVRPALMNVGGGPTTITTGDLINRGYHCEVVSVGSIECSRSGSPTYWCDQRTKTCSLAPFGKQAGNQLFGPGSWMAGRHGVFVANKFP